MSCVSPMAPTGLRARGFHSDSTWMSAASRGAGTPFADADETTSGRYGRASSGRRPPLMVLQPVLAAVGVEATTSARNRTGNSAAASTHTTRKPTRVRSTSVLP